jgi:C4-dicarboxylate transporter DctQ subunit
MLESINKFIDKLESFVIISLMLLATIVAIAQVIARYVFNNSLYWSEETILYALIIMSFVAGSMGVRYAAHIYVEVVQAFAGPRLAYLLKIVAAGLGIIFACTLIYYGSRLFLNTREMGQLSPAIRIPVAYIYLAIPVSGFCMVLRYLNIIFALMRREPVPTPSMEISAA